MDLSIAKRKPSKIVLQQWRFRQSVELERQKQSMREERQRFESERREFEREKREYAMKKKLETGRAEQERHLFDMKWKLLEEEARKLANERQQIERQRDFYRCVSEHERASGSTGDVSLRIAGELFFVGVTDEQALKKRYKDLIKIYHPDNLAGDTGTIQEINREYDRLQGLYR